MIIIYNDSHILKSDIKCLAICTSKDMNAKNGLIKEVFDICKPSPKGNFKIGDC